MTRIAVLFSALVLWLIAPAALSNTVASLNPLACENTRPELVVQMSSPLAAGQWRLMLNDADLTPLTNQGEGVLRVQVPEKLGVGTYRVTLMLAADTGLWRQQNVGAFEVCVAQSTTTYQLNAHLAASSELTANTPLGQRPDDLVTQGGAAVRLEHLSRGWNAGGDANFVYDSRNGLVPSGREFDLGQYRLSWGQAETWRLTLGHHNVEADGLAVSNFHRPGLSLGVKLPALNSRVQGFHQANQDSTGWQTPVGGKGHTSGLIWDVWVDPDNPGRGQLTGMHARSESDTDTADGFFFPTPESRRVHSLQVRGGWQSYLQLRAEKARSSADFAADGFSESRRQRGAAEYLKVESTPLPASTWYWTAQASHQEVDREFISPTNPFIQANVRSREFATHLSRGGLSFDLTHTRERDNLDRSDAATNHQQLSRVDAGYSFNSGLKLLGQTYLSANLEHAERTSTGLFPSEGEVRSVAMRVQHGLEKFSWHWQVSHINAQSDGMLENRSLNTELGTSFKLGSMATGLAITRQQTDLPGNGQRDFFHYALNLRTASDAKTQFYLNLDYNELEEQGAFFDVHDRRRSAGIGLSRTFLEGPASVKLSLTGSYLHQQQLFGSQEGLQLLLRLEIAANHSS